MVHIFIRLNLGMEFLCHLPSISRNSTVLFLLSFFVEPSVPRVVFNLYYCSVFRLYICLLATGMVWWVSCTSSRRNEHSLEDRRRKMRGSPWALGVESFLYHGRETVSGKIRLPFWKCFHHWSWNGAMVEREKGWRTYQFPWVWEIFGLFFILISLCSTSV